MSRVYGRKERPKGIYHKGIEYIPKSDLTSLLKSHEELKGLARDMATHLIAIEIVENLADDGLRCENCKREAHVSMALHHTENCLIGRAENFLSEVSGGKDK